MRGRKFTFYPTSSSAKIITILDRNFMLPFFVYGTLLPGQPNAYLWQTAVATIQPATLPNGRLYDLGFYPMLVQEPGHQVQGVLLTIHPEAYASLLAKLDYLEGYDPTQPNNPGYRRLDQAVYRPDGQKEMAWVYVGTADLVVGYPPIPAGDWRQYSQQQPKALTAWWQTVQTVYGRHGHPPPPDAPPAHT